MKGCLVIHGITGTPATMGGIGEGLSDAGFRVLSPCLAGHGGELQDLANSKKEDWYATVREAYHELKKDCDEVYYVGMSLGALLGLRLALDEKEKIKALALLSTPVQLLIWTKLLLKTVRYTPLRYAVKSVAKNYQQSVADPEGQRLYREQSLGRLPSKAVFELADMQKVVRSRLHEIENPLLLLHSRNDRVAPYSNVHYIREGVSSHVVETATFTKSRHVITLDIEQELATNAIVQFFKRFS